MPSCSLEANLARAYSRGELLDSGPAPRSPEDDGAVSSDACMIPSSVIRSLLLSDLPAEPGRQRQLHLRGFVINGPLDLRFARIDHSIRFTECSFTDPVMLSEAHLRSVSFRGSSLPRLDAEHVTLTGDLVLSDTRFHGPVRLAGAHLGDDLCLAGAHVAAASAACAVDLDNAEIMGRLQADDVAIDGTFRMETANLHGTLHMRRATLTGTAGPAAGDGKPGARGDAWYADGMTVEGEVDASDLRANGRVSLIAASVLDLVLQHVTVQNSGTAVELDRLRAQGTVRLDEHSDVTGGISAPGVDVGDSLSLANATFRAPPLEGEAGVGRVPAAVDLRHARVGKDLVCTPGFSAFGNVDLTAAHVRGTVGLDGARLQPIVGDCRPLVLVADLAEVAELCAGDLRTGGIMRIRNATISAGLTVTQAETPEVEVGSTGRYLRLNARGVSVGRDAELATEGTVRLRSAAIHGDLSVALGRLDAGEEYAAAADLSFATARVLELTGAPRRGLVDLTRASVRLLSDEPAGLSDLEGAAAVLDGFVYDDIARLGELSSPEEPARPRRRRQGRRDSDLRTRLAWLAAGTRHVRDVGDGYVLVGFTPHPYRQLADVYQRNGLDDDGRRVLRRLHQERTTHKAQPGLGRAWNLLQDHTMGYGYAPQLALGWLLLLAALSAVYFTLSSKLDAVRSLLLSLALLLPGTGFQSVSPWDKGQTALGHVIAGALILCGLVLGATVIAGLARVIKK